MRLNMNFNSPQDFTKFGEQNTETKAQDKSDKPNKNTTVNIQTSNSPSPLSAICHFFLMLGSILTFIRNTVFNIIFLICALAIFGLLSFADKFNSKSETLLNDIAQEEPEDATIQPVLYLNLDGPIYEYALPTDDYSKFTRKLDEKLNHRSINYLLTIEKAFNIAKKHTLIKEIYIDLSYTKATLPAANRIAKAIEIYKRARPQTKITAFANSYGASAYRIATACDKIVLDPLGGFDFKGLASSSLYFKDLLDKFRVEPMVFRAGEFKSAVEPFTQNSMSDGVKAEYQYIFNHLWKEYKDSLSKRKNANKAISIIFDNPENYLSLLSQVDGNEATLLKEANLVDELQSKIDLNISYSKKYGHKKTIFNPKVTSYTSLISQSEQKEMVAKVVSKNADGTKNTIPQSNIAVMYGIGQINDYGDTPTDFTPENIQSQIEQILKDKTIKAVIFYLNSPGGSVTASEKIRNLVLALKEEKKVPVYIAMNGLAASGAYWISTAGDKVFATSDTITGSIGVFSLGLSFHDLLNEYGVYQEGGETSELAKSSIAQAMPESQRQMYSMQVASIYKNFISLVKKAHPRLASMDYQNYAEGKVFMAKDALRLHLIDTRGTLSNVVSCAKNRIKTPLRSGIKVIHMSAEPQSNANLFRSLFVSKASNFISDEHIKFALDLFEKNSKTQNNQPKLMALGQFKSLQM